MNISRVRKLTGLSEKSIRFYESRGLIKVNRRDNGYRDYSESDVGLLINIRNMRRVGIPVSDIRLWRDGVVTTVELFRKRLRTLEDDDKYSLECRQICEGILKGEPTAALTCPGSEFQENTERERIPDHDLLLGVDIGTTSISAQVISAKTGKSVQVYGFDHNAALRGTDPEAYAQDAEILTGRSAALIDSLISTYPSIRAIGITGQMHGIVCIGKDRNILSPLYTWQNGFGSRKLDNKNTVCDIIREKTGENLPTGYGITTLYALRELHMLPEGTVRVSTIADLLASRLCGCGDLSHPTNAAALGCYDIEKRDFDKASLDILGIERRMLPSVSEDYALAGYYGASGRDIPVSVAIGDNQAGVFGSLADDRSVLVNVGTSSQVSIISEDPRFCGGEERPYFDGKRLLSGALLSGGKSYSMLKDLVRGILSAFGSEPADRQIYEFLNREAEKNKETALVADTRFCGTRSDPDVRGSVENIGYGDFSIGDISAAFLRGMITELYDMYMKIDPSGKKRETVISGNAMRNNALLRDICAFFFGTKPKIPANTEEAAFGAALYAGICAGLITREQSRKMIAYNE